MTRYLILAAMLLPAACGTLGASTERLEGSKWAFTMIDGTAPVSSKAALNIDAGRIGAYVGCNGMGGDLKIAQGKLVTGPIIATEMYCDGVMEQESAVGALLGSSPAFKIKGEVLHLEGGGHQADLKRLD